MFLTSILHLVLKSFISVLSFDLHTSNIRNIHNIFIELSRYFVVLLEAKAELKALVQLFKDTLADPEKHMGRLNKEDKVFSFERTFAGRSFHVLS